jgi:photosystem II stability/assembly factor-like uncharacterized protein
MAMLLAIVSVALLAGGVSATAASPPAHPLVDAITFDPGDSKTIYLSTESGPLFASTIRILETSDGGAHWRALAGRGLPKGQAVAALAVEPAQSGVLYAGIRGRFDEHPIPTLYKSTNGGASWHRIPSPSPVAGIYALAVDPEKPATIYAGAPGGCMCSGETGLYKTADGGRSWHALNYAFERGADAVVIDPTDTEHLYAGFDEGVETTFDGGMT